ASNGNLCLHNRKLPTFVQVVFLVFVTAYFLDYYLFLKTITSLWLFGIKLATINFIIMGRISF
ncbi:hypothetical protein, partial [Moraxella bovis]|uniref:hypothetical protein n=1 Tax=Moraxella bovis TaxID=476 RepID=UPI001B800770